MEKSKVISGLFWKFAERIGAQGVSLIVSIVLARILSPEDYGLISLITIFITISNVFIESGMGTALIQKKDADSEDFSTVFYFNLFVSIIMYVILFLIASLIAKFYNINELIPIVRVLGLTVIISGLKGVQNAYVSKKMMFRKFFMATLIGTIISAIIGIVMAYNGFGAWSLVAQQLTNTIISTIMLWIIVPWRPTLEISLNKLKGLYKFGWKILCSSLIDTIYNELYGLTIGKLFNTETLAYYNRGNQFPKLITENVNGSISSVMLPTLSKEQDNKEKMKNIMRKSIQTSSFILFPILIGLAVVAEPLVRIILTDKWLPSVPIMQLLCFSYLLWPIHTVNLQAINALGRSDIYLKLEIAKKIVGVLGLCISIPFGIYAMVIAKIVAAIISTFINASPNKKLLNYNITEQLKDILPSFLISSLMGVVVYSIIFLNINVWITIIVQVLLGIIIYVILAKLFKIKIYEYLLGQVIEILNKKKGKIDERKKIEHRIT